MSFAHMLILGIIALIVIPPDQLPVVAKQVAKFIYELKRSADQLMGDLKQEAMFKPDDIIDKDLKQKLAELQSDISKPVNLDGQNNHGHGYPNKIAKPEETPAVVHNPEDHPTIAEVTKTEVKKHE